MEFVLLWVTWAHEYKDVFINIGEHRTFKKNWRYVILTKLCQHVNEIMGIAVNNLRIFYGPVFL